TPPASNREHVGDARDADADSRAHTSSHAPTRSAHDDGRSSHEHKTLLEPRGARGCRARLEQRRGLLSERPLADGPSRSHRGRAKKTPALNNPSPGTGPAGDSSLSE